MENNNKPLKNPFSSFTVVKEETPYYKKPPPTPMSSNELKIFLDDWIPYID